MPSHGVSEGGWVGLPTLDSHAGFPSGELDLLRLHFLIGFYRQSSAHRIQGDEPLFPDSETRVNLSISMLFSPGGTGGGTFFLGLHRSTIVPQPERRRKRRKWPSYAR